MEFSSFSNSFYKASFLCGEIKVRWRLEDRGRRDSLPAPVWISLSPVVARNSGPEDTSVKNAMSVVIIIVKPKSLTPKSNHFEKKNSHLLQSHKINF